MLADRFLSRRSDEMHTSKMKVASKSTLTGCVIALVFLTSTSRAMAQSSITLYGLFDVFLGYQTGTVGGKHTSLTVLGNNAEAVSRIGLRGTEDIGGGYHVNFALENGFDPGTGRQQNPFRFFDRQAWVGVSGDFGEVRAGRQNSPLFTLLANVDALGAVTYGSGFNNFVMEQIRVDNDIAYFTPTFHHTRLEFHYAVGGVPGEFTGNAVYQIGMQTVQGPFVAIAAWLKASNATNTNSVQQLLAGGNYDYGHGKIYVGFFRTNDVISATTTNALTSPPGKGDPAAGPVTNIPGNYHNTYTVSADYRFTSALTVGVDYAVTIDRSGLGNNAREVGIVANYDVSRSTRLYAVGTRLLNSNGARFVVAGAALSPGSFLTPDPGTAVTAFQVGMRYSF
jgi:predicted porin